MTIQQSNTLRAHAQAGFTLIELIVVIVILGILAATALPKFASLGGDARIAKMNAAAGSLKAAAAMFHGQWLAAGSPAAATTTSSALKMENVAIGYDTYGYPIVGSDAATSGIVPAAGNLDDYTVTYATGILTVMPDSSHPNCLITYTESVTGATPKIDLTAVTNVTANAAASIVAVTKGTDNCG